MYIYHHRVCNPPPRSPAAYLSSDHPPLRGVYYLQGTLKHTLVAARPTVFLGVPRVWEKIKEAMLEVRQKPAARPPAEEIVVVLITWETVIINYTYTD